MEAGLRAALKEEQRATTGHLALPLSADTAFSADWRCLAAPRCSRLSVPFSQRLLTLCLCVTVLDSCGIASAPVTVFLFIAMLRDLWCFY